MNNAIINFENVNNLILVLIFNMVEFNCFFNAIYILNVKKAIKFHNINLTLILYYIIY